MDAASAVGSAADQNDAPQAHDAGTAPKGEVSPDLTLSRKAVPVDLLIGQPVEGWPERIERVRASSDFPDLCSRVADADATAFADPEKSYGMGLSPVLVFYDGDQPFIVSAPEIVVAAKAVDKRRLTVLCVDKDRVPEAQIVLNRLEAQHRRAKTDEDYESRVLWGI